MDERITGVMIYYYFVCKRKLWYFCHDIRMEAENEDVVRYSLDKFRQTLVYDDMVEAGNAFSPAAYAYG